VPDVNDPDCVRLAITVTIHEMKEDSIRVTAPAVHKLAHFDLEQIILRRQGTTGRKGVKLLKLVEQSTIPSRRRLWRTPGEIEVCRVYLRLSHVGQFDGVAWDLFSVWVVPQGSKSPGQLASKPWRSLASRMT
jgi:hypothetical protein